MTNDVLVNPRCSRVERKSAAVSPTVVAMTLMSQKKMVISGTLFSIFVNVDRLDFR